jgi:adenylate kinase
MQIASLMPNTTVGFVVGGPGSGKGTVCDLLCKEFGFISINSGTLIRLEVSQQTQVGREIEKFVKVGEMVPDRVVLDLIKKAIRINGPEKTYLIHGETVSLVLSVVLNSLVLSVVFQVSLVLFSKLVSSRLRSV